MMKILEQLLQLERLDGLIRRKGTGPPRALARKLAVSERQVHNLLVILRGFGAEIDYCRTRQTYYYQSEIHFYFRIVVKKDPRENPGIS